MTDALELELRAAMNERAQSPQVAEVVERLQQVDYSKGSRRARPSRPGLWPVLGGAGVALAAAIVTAIVLLSTGTPLASEGWAAVPTKPTPRALETAVHKCYRVGADDSQLALPAPGGAAHPVLAEARGESAAAIYAVDGQVYECLYANGTVYVDGIRYTTVASASMGPLRVPPGPDQLSIPYGVEGGGSVSGPTDPLTPAQRRELNSQRPTGGRTSLIDGGAYYALGQAGSAVSAIKFSFADGKTVTASVQNGWYFAWWPWMSDPTSVTVTTSTGTITSPMKNTWPAGHGSRPYPACQPGSSGCVFDTKQPAATTTTSTGTTTTPTTSKPGATELATATRECDAFTLTYSVMPADAFAGPPVLTEVHGTSVALLNVTNGGVDTCFIGGDEKDLHKFFAFQIANYGLVHVAPGPDQLSVPYSEHNGVGGGRSFGGPLRRNPTPGQREGRRERASGGGYGPYAFGQAGSDVSAVTFAFTNGKTIAAKLANGWYFAWWPWISAPTSVTVTTRYGKTTSPVSSATSASVAVAPGCKPGSSGCVFVKTSPVPPTTTTTATTTTTSS